MDKRYQVFISSTFTDLKEERQAVLKSVLMLDHMPAGMELFPATDDTAWQLICDVIDSSDYYILVLGGRYGSTDEEGLGFTEKEYEYATAKRIPVIPFLHRNPDKLSREKTDKNERRWNKLSKFRNRVEKAHSCTYWDTAHELQSQVIVGLTATVKRNPRQGWIRTGKLASEEATQRIISLQQVVAEQQQELDRLSHAPPDGIQELAQGDDLVDIEFVVTFTLPNANYRDPQKTIRERFERPVAWKEIFGAIAPNLTEPQRETKLRTDLARFLRERFAEEITARHPDRTATRVTLKESLVLIIRVQLSALGLIESRQEIVGDKYGKEKEIRFVELTRYGRSELIRVCAIHKTGSSDVPHRPGNTHE